MFVNRISRQKIQLSRSSSSLSNYHEVTRQLSTKLHDYYNFKPPPTLTPQNPTNTIIHTQSKPNNNNNKQVKPPYRPPSSLDRSNKKPIKSNLPFDFRFSYTESSENVRPIGLREPKYSPFGPGRLDREWTGVCAPAVDVKLKFVEEGSESKEKDLNLEEKRRRERLMIQGDELSNADRKKLVEDCQRHKTKRQINIGRDGLTHNMLNDIHNHWKHSEAVRIKCMGVPTVDMKNVCFQLEDKTNGKVIFKHGGLLVLYRGRNYNIKSRPVIPIMLWKPHEPVYPRLIKTTVDGLSIEETKEMRKRGLAIPALTRLAKNGYYGSLVPMVRDAFLVTDMVRIDCQGLEKSDYKKIGAKLRDMVPCILVTFDKEQVVVWRGNDYKAPEDDKDLLNDQDFFIRSESSLDSCLEKKISNATQSKNKHHSWSDDD